MTHTRRLSLTHRSVTGMRHALLSGLLMTALAGNAGARPRIRFVQSTRLHDAGLQLKLMADAVARPLPLPTMHTYQMRRGDETRTVDLFDPTELWRHSQHIGAWSNDEGTTLQLASITHLLPDTLRGKHRSREAIVGALDDRDNQPARWTAPLLERWLRNYTGHAAIALQEQARPPRRFRDCYTVTTESQPLCGYALRFNTRYIGLGDAPDAWFAILLTYDGRVGEENALAALENDFLPAFEPMRDGRARSASDRLSRLMQNAHLDSGVDPVAGLDASRQRAAESIRNLEGWWSVHTDHYVFLSNLESRHRSMVRQLQSDLELLRDAYEAIIPPLEPIGAASVVRVFATPSEYNAYMPPARRWTDGLWMASRGELVIRPPDDARDRRRHREKILRIAYHEAFHQYLHYALNRRHTAAWFNEGHAALFEAAEIHRHDRVTIEEDDRKAELLEQLADDDALQVTPVLGMDYAHFYAGNERTRSRNYAIAWGLCYYLRKAAPVDTDRRYANVADTYRKAIAEGATARQATVAAFSGIKMARVNEDFASFWTSRRRRRAAERYDLPTP